MKKIELVSPAGNFPSLIAAINAGADAVYFGGRKFNARLGVENFTEEEIKKAILLCKKNNVKAYITINTLISDKEISECLKFLKYINELSPSAVIIQDVGLLNLIKENKINIPLHASTQMTVVNSETAQFLKDIGFKRIILARELTREEIVNIKNKVDIEVEVFTHGALCFSYSGLCLFSSLVGGRSGNRGICPQVCRLSYDILEDNKKINKTKIYPLSCGDLCLIDYIPQLVNSNISALKIEGRGKSWEYVAVVTSAYRKVIDNYYENPDKFFVEEKDKIKLQQIFNRGFTSGFTFSDKNILSFTRPNNRGIFMGRIQDIDYEKFRIKFLTNFPVNSGDKVEIWTTRGGRVSVEIKEEGGKGTVSLKIPEDLINKIKVKDRVFKVFDAELYKEIKKYAQDKS